MGRDDDRNMTRRDVIRVDVTTHKTRQGAGRDEGRDLARGGTCLGARRDEGWRVFADFDQVLKRC